MKRYFYLLIVINIILAGRMPVRAQAPTDPFSIKFKSFTPVPTRTPSPRPTWTPIPTAIPVTITEEAYPTFGTTSAPIPTVDIAACSYIGSGIYSPQPRYLGRTLCEKGAFWPAFPADFIPPNLVNLDKALGGKFWLRVKTIQARQEIVDNLEKLLKAIKNTGCITFVGYVYRSYQEQKAIYDGYNCNPNQICPAAPPGYSAHQAGIAADLFCMGLDANNNAVLENVPNEIVVNSQSYGFIHPVDWDTPHFVGL